MNTTLLHPVSPHLLRQFATFQSRRGRWGLAAHLALRRLAWHRFVTGSATVKRAVDVCGSLAAILVLSPLLLPLAALVRLDGGPAFFTQTRVGRFGRQFRMFKFRSMRPDAEQHLAALLATNQHQTGVTFKIKQDPRITRLGYWLRRYSLDELPQFFNVLRGDMSLVGPRPPVPREVALYSLADRRRLSTKPGLTCTWQVGGRSEIDFPGQVRLDVSYIESQSLLQDLSILARTPRAVLFGSGAY